MPGLFLCPLRKPALKFRPTSGSLTPDSLTSEHRLEAERLARASRRRLQTGPEEEL
jgi:hypothetical protein